MVKLILYQKDQKLGVELKDGVYKLGREKPADIVIPDPSVSASHAELQIDGDVYRIRDLGSRNGTTVNGKPVKTAKVIKTSDEIRLGQVRIALENPEEIKPIPSKGPGLSGPTVKMEAVKVAASRLSWAVRYWLSAAMAIIFLLVIFMVVMLYSESVASQTRVTNRFKALAAQYIHVFAQGTPEVVPGPVVDESMKGPLMVANSQGMILYPAADPNGKPVVSPLIDPKTGKIDVKARWSLARLKLPGEKDPDAFVYSYPIRVSDEVAGYVMARPAREAESGVGTVLLMLVFGAVISLIVLAFALKPPNRLLRDEIEALREKISPFFNEFVEELPRSGVMPEMASLADEIEKSLRIVQSQAAGGSSPDGVKKLGEYAPLAADLLEAARIPHCFVDGDFKVLTASSSLRKISEMARASVGTSIFDAGMNNIQSKQVVQALTEARKDGKASVRVTFMEDGVQISRDVSVRSFPPASGKGQLYGLVFNIAG